MLEFRVELPKKGNIRISSSIVVVKNSTKIRISENEYYIIVNTKYLILI